jgi:hypothetical protein
MLPTATVSKRHYALLGMLFFQKEPERAQKYISDYIPAIQAPESDFKKINSHYKKFCRIQDIEPEFGPIHKRDKVALRRLFIAVMLHLYNPQAYFLPALTTANTAQQHFATAIAQVLGINKSTISRNIRQAIFWEKQYEDFAQKVSELLEKIQDAGANS